MGKLNRHGYEELIREDIEWLDGIRGNSLEGSHIREVLAWSIDALYPTSQPCTEEGEGRVFDPDKDGRYTVGEGGIWDHGAKDHFPELVASFEVGDDLAWARSRDIVRLANLALHSGLVATPSPTVTDSVGEEEEMV